MEIFDKPKYFLKNPKNFYSEMQKLVISKKLSQCKSHHQKLIKKTIEKIKNESQCNNFNEDEIILIREKKNYSYYLL